jgi:hypothetical protein
VEKEAITEGIIIDTCIFYTENLSQMISELTTETTKKDLILAECNIDGFFRPVNYRARAV